MPIDTYREQEQQIETYRFRRRVLLTTGILGVSFLLLLLAMWGLPAWNRYQDREYARNRITINALVIQQTQQLVDVERQKAAIRLAEAEGIRNAQRTINETLTDRYLQHEAIQAQFKMAGSPNHTQIYFPVGTNGVPLVRTLGPGQ